MYGLSELKLRASFAENRVPNGSIRRGKPPETIPVWVAAIIGSTLTAHNFWAQATVLGLQERYLDTVAASGTSETLTNNQ